MKNMSQHTEWLSMIEVSGPFLALSVLERVFPQGLESLDTYRKNRIRSAYEEWRDAVEDNDPQLPELHCAWIKLVLEELLEYDQTVLIAATDEFSYNSPQGEGHFKIEFVLKRDGSSVPIMFVSIMPEGTDLEKVKVGDDWPVPIYERMTLLCRDKEVRLGLVTNGERWMLVNAPVGSTSSHVSWYARLWFQEPLTLKAFQSLLGVRRWFGPVEKTLPVMLEESLQHHEEVTDTLGEQVKRAVEVLVQCLDKADQDRNRELLHDVPVTDLFESGLTVMMRLVFVLCAEERGLMLLGDQIYDQFYAISSLRDQLDEERIQYGDEILERRYDAWTRLLAVFRAVYGGVEHDSLRMPALGGSLFDPDRFPFLEGRAKETHWRDTPAQPLPIDNRTVLLLLEALQILEQRGGALLLSYKALDVEQIGHVYEGLLEHTVCRLETDTLGLLGSQKAKNPNIALADLEAAQFDSEEALVSLVETTTSRSKSAIQNDLAKNVDDVTFGKIVTVCGGDMKLAGRLKPFAHLLRCDAWGDVIVYRSPCFAITLGANRRETGTHYTPKSLTESIVEKTLEPVVYVGPAEGEPREEWQLKSSSELLELKICDPAMGSGAFLVQVCRWLSERLVEAWGKEEGRGEFVTVDGEARESAGSAELMPDSLDERLLIARRLVADKCLYGVDINPLAVELAKLSIWLITLAKGRPFGFLDHNLRSGDSLLGLHRLEQLTQFSLHPEEKKTIYMFASNIENSVKDATQMRKQIRKMPIRDIRDVHYMERLDQEARQKLKRIEHIADAILGEALAFGVNQRVLDTAMDNLSAWATDYIEGNKETGQKIITEARRSLSIDLPAGKAPRKPFHWILEFPEVFERGGFDGIVGNPPFMGGKKISGTLGSNYREYIVHYLADNRKGNADLCVFFMLRGCSLINLKGCFGFIASSTIAEGETREVGLDTISTHGCKIYAAHSSKPWPGKASVTFNSVWITAREWSGPKLLGNKLVKDISCYLKEAGEVIGNPKKIPSNAQKSFIGSFVYGQGFVITPEQAQGIVDINRKCSEVIFPYLIGDEFLVSPTQSPASCVINFFDFSLERASQFTECMEIVQKNVKPERQKLKDKGYREKWWQFGRRAVSLYNTINGMKRVLFHCFTSKYIAFSFVPANIVYAAPHVVVAFDDFARFAVLQSSFHDSWVREYTSYLGSTPRYTPTDCFETFVFPSNLKCLEDIGEEYYSARQILMQANQEGITATYNRYHDPEESSEQVHSLRALQILMDKTVAYSYGWDDLNLNHGFHETSQGMRFTISEDARREVLQRLLKLNLERYEEEVAQGLHNRKNASPPRNRKTTEYQKHGNMTLFDLVDTTLNESQ